MTSFKETRDFILLCNDEGILNDEELLVLYQQYKCPSLDLWYSSYPLFDLDDMEDDECVAEFRVKKRDIPALAEALRIPDWISCNQQSKAEGTEALCMVLKRFAYPCQYSDMLLRFARPVSVLSMVTNEVINYIYTVHSHQIINWNPAVSNPRALQTYAQVISQRGSPLQNCFGFVDGTVRPIARPNNHQRVVYNGHKRVHALKFQSLALPNGIIGHLYGPVGKYFCS